MGGGIDRKADLVAELQRRIARGFSGHHRTFPSIWNCLDILGRGPPAINCAQLNVTSIFSIAHNLIVCNLYNNRNRKPGRTPMSVKVLYETTAKATGGRDGTASTSDGAFSVKLSTPKELGGGGGAGNNPEQLFAAGYAACFIGAMKAVAAQGGGVKVPA